MAVLQAADIGDIVTSTLRELGRFKLQNLMHTIQRFTILPSMLQERRVVVESGYETRFNVQTGIGGNAKQVGLFDTDVTNVVDTTTFATAPFRFTKTSYQFDEREIPMNSGASQIFNLIKSRRQAEFGHMVELMEDEGWGKPATVADNESIWGLPYHAVPNATKGFNGKNPQAEDAAAFSDQQGINSTVETQHANYTDTYAAVSKDDLIDALSEAAAKTRFIAPMPQMPGYGGDAPDTILYTDYVTQNAIKRLGEQQNENLGRDIDSMAGRVTFQGNPIVWVPQLDDTTKVDPHIITTLSGTNPVYLWNWAKAQIQILKGFFMREKGPFMASGQPLVAKVRIDTGWNLRVFERRAMSVLYKTA